MTLHFRVRLGAVSLRFRNPAEITVLVCEQKLYISDMVFVQMQKLSCLPADVSYFLCCTASAKKEIGDVCTQHSVNIAWFHWG